MNLQKKDVPYGGVLPGEILASTIAQLSVIFLEYTHEAQTGTLQESITIYKDSLDHV